VELWFVREGNKLYFLAHRDSDWWRNLLVNPDVELEVENKTYSGKGLVSNVAGQRIFDMFRRKYGESVVDDWYGGSGGDRTVVEVQIV